MTANTSSNTIKHHQTPTNQQMASQDIFMVYNYEKAQSMHRITAISKTDVDVKFFPKSSNPQSATSSMKMSFIQFRNWFNTNLRFIEVDSEPLTSIEFVFPLLPSVLIKHSDLSKMRLDIMMALKFTEDQWATQKTASVDLTECDNEECDEECNPDELPPSPTDSG